MKRIARALIPPKLRLYIRVFWIGFTDLATGTRFQFVKNSPEKLERAKTWPERITIVQPINVSKWAENKKHNLRLAISRFQNVPIYPGEIFSFWRFVGNPTKKAGYKIGINIIKNKLDFDYGGGLCQLSGLLYHLALTSALDIVERYPHSADLYTDETRYTPLGADATTAYGYKDLRLRNTLKVPLCFRVRIEENRLIGALCSPEPLREYELRFNKVLEDGMEKVDTLRRFESGEFKVICKQSYVIAKHDTVI
ncbi:MAG: VanW family protein [Candidatus Aminicenantes bacterium]|nr:MAG: VanW family protein [Candidatus Aminicenantes bacterium]